MQQLHSPKLGKLGLPKIVMPKTYVKASAFNVNSVDLLSCGLLLSAVYDEMLSRLFEGKICLPHICSGLTVAGYQVAGSMVRFARIVLPFLLNRPVLSAFNGTSIRCNNSTLPTPTYGDAGGLFTVCAENTIDAPVDSVYDAILDFKSYSTWNTFVVNVDVPRNVTQTPKDVYVGMKMVLTTQGILPQNSTSNEIITFLSPEDQSGFAMAVWRNDDGLNSTFLPAEHPSLLTDNGNSSTRYVSYETYYEPGATLLLPLEQNIQHEFEQQGIDLKSYVESRVLD